MGEHHTILLADDDFQIHSAVKRVAKQFGHRLIQVTTGADVVSAVADHRPDLVVLDLGFHDADGRDLLSRLKREESTREIPVLVWSGRSDSDSRRVALELGAEDYVEKVDAQTLMRKVERVLLNQSGPGVSGTRLVAAEQIDNPADEHGSRTG